MHSKPCAYYQASVLISVTASRSTFCHYPNLQRDPLVEGRQLLGDSSATAASSSTWTVYKSISAPAVSRGSKIVATADLSEVYQASYACVQQLFPPRFCLCRPTLLSLKSRLRADFQLLDTCLTLLRLRRWPSRCVVPCVLQDAQNFVQAFTG